MRRPHACKPCPWYLVYSFAFGHFILPAQIEAKSMIYTSGHGPSFGTFKGSEHADPSFMSVDHDATFGNSANFVSMLTSTLKHKARKLHCD